MGRLNTYLHRDCPENSHQKSSKSEHKAKPPHMESHNGGSHSDNLIKARLEHYQPYNLGDWRVDS